MEPFPLKAKLSCAMLSLTCRWISSLKGLEERLVLSAISPYKLTNDYYLPLPNPLTVIIRATYSMLASDLETAHRIAVALNMWNRVPVKGSGRDLLFNM